MSKVETYTVEFEDPENPTGPPYEIPIAKGTPPNLVPRVIEGYYRMMKARQRAAPILKQQAAQYPTPQEQGAAPGTAAESTTGQILKGAFPGATSLGGIAQAVFNTAQEPGVPAAATGNEPTSSRVLDIARGAFAGGALGSPQATTALSLPEQLKASPLVQTAKTIKNVVQGGIDKLRYGPEVTQIEQKIAPSGKEAQAITGNISEKLAQDPALLKLPKGAQFDKAIVDRFKAAQLQLDAAELQVPSTATVPKQPLVDTLKEGIKNLQVETPQGAISGHEDAVKVLQSELGKVEKFGDQIPFSDLRKYRVQLDQAIRTSGGWKETASAADRATMEAKRFVANTIRSDLAEVAPVLKPANEEFTLMHRALEASGIDPNLGRRVTTIGKASQSGVLAKTGKRLLGAGVLGAGGAAGWQIYHILEGSK